MPRMTKEELLRIEEIGDKYGWVTPLTQEDREYFYYLRKVFKRYNIVPSKATRLEYNFVIRVAESEFYNMPVISCVYDEDLPSGS